LLCCSGLAPRVPIPFPSRVPELLWQPSPERAAAAQLTAFRRAVAARRGLALDDTAALWRWSVDDPRAFWAEVWDACGVLASRRFDEVVDDPARLPGAHWFAGARLNFAENLLRRADAAPALVFRNEAGARRELSWAELRRSAARLARGMRAQGVGPGDRVAAYLPNLPETVIAMLAAASLGALFSSCSPDFGLEGVFDRFGQIEPKLLFAADGYVYGGKRFASLPTAGALAARLPSLARLVVVPYLEPRPDLAGLPRAAPFAELLGHDDDPQLAFAQLPFEHPLYVLFSSGTTGRPKCIVHGAGGVLLQHLKEHRLHTDLRRDDRFFYFTTCGWMMWNWLVSGLASGATLVLYDGSPFQPDAEALFRLADEERVAVFGTSAKFLAAAEKAGARPARTLRLDALRSVLSTGSPLAPEGFRFVYRELKRDLCLSSISGGTDICSCFFAGDPTAPVHAGELQCRGLGMAVEAFGADGRPRRGAPGELVCTQAAPCMPLGFWDDPDGARYRAAYFERFPGVWHHGDFVEISERGTAVVLGRSDATLNPGGVRIGTAEIYRPVETLPEVEDALVVGQDFEGDVRVVLFVKLRAGLELDDALRDEIRRAIRERASPRHVPAVIAQVADIPYTRSGKKVELAVRDVIHGRSVQNVEALANPEALELFRAVAELRR
jgi:acetoacetyl-CoA synthetase